MLTMYKSKNITMKNHSYVPSRKYNRLSRNFKNINHKTNSKETQFFSITLIHGLVHITKKDVHPLERFVWVLAVISALVSIILINLSSWKHYQENPVVISIERDYKQWNTSFPSLTFCPFNKTDQEATELLAQKFSFGPTNDIVSFIQTMTESTLETLDEVPPLNAPQPVDYVDLILNGSFKFKFDFVTSNLNSYENDSFWMTGIFSEMGVCYTFASKVAKYLDPRKFSGLSRHSIELLPSLVSSPLDGDVIVQIVDMNTGGKIQIHSDTEVPDIFTRGTTLTSLYMKTLEVTALSIVSSPEISSLSLKQRKCQFLHEDTLLFRPIYTYNLCRMDCRMRLSIKLCNCVPYFYWGLKDKYKICDPTGLQCVAKNKEKLLKLQVNVEDENNCKCLPPCDYTTYHIDEEQSALWFRGTNLRWGMIKYPKIRFKRDILFGITELLVYAGGSIGLFLGCSVLSFIEIIFCCLQPVFRYMRKSLDRS